MSDFAPEITDKHIETFREIVRVGSKEYCLQYIQKNRGCKACPCCSYLNDWCIVLYLEWVSLGKPDGTRLRSSDEEIKELLMPIINAHDNIELIKNL